MQDRVILVTGAAGGIGAACCDHLRSAGATVVTSDLHHADVACDITQPGECDRAAQFAVEKYGRLDGLVNSAGISRPHDSVSLPPEEWAGMVNVQLNGSFYIAQACARRMWDRGGSIVFISSLNAEAAFPRRAAYCASKAGVAMLTKVLAAEWASRKIRVNAVGPAHVATEMTRRNIAAGNVSEAQINARIPMGRLVQPGEVADAVAFLLGEQSSFITGQSLYVDGGWLAYGYF